MKKSAAEKVTMLINNDLLNWIEKQINNRQFSNQSDGIRKCIEIAKRVYEKANPEESMKFIIGRDIEENSP